MRIAQLKKKGGNEEHSLPFVCSYTQELLIGASSALLFSLIQVKPGIF